MYRPTGASFCISSLCLHAHISLWLTLCSAVTRVWMLCLSTCCEGASNCLAALGLSASNRANRSSPTPVALLSSAQPARAGPAQINVGRGKKTKTTNLKNVGHGAWPSSSWTTQRVWMWSTVIIPHARHGSRAGSTVCFSLCAKQCSGAFRHMKEKKEMLNVSNCYLKR